MIVSRPFTSVFLFILACRSFGQCELVIPQITFQADCAVGGTLRWTGLFMYGNQAIQSPCGGPYVYSLGNGATYSYGTIAADWVQESPTSWRYNAPLPAGFSYVFIHPANALIPPASPACDQWSPFCVASCLSVCYADAQFTVPTSPGDCGVNFHLKAFLDGAYTSGTLMSDALRVANLLPTTQPYTGLGYVYTGSPTGLTISPSLLAAVGGNAIVDWVVVELRDPSTPATVVASRPALVQRDGDIVSTDGDPYINFPVPAGSYHVALRHRNHLGVMTGSPVSLTVDPANTTIDFRGQSFAAYGSNARVLKSGNFCLWAGDATGNGLLSYTGSGNDRDPILVAIGGSTPNAVVTNVYDRRDTNLDGVIKYTGSGNDRDIILTNVGSAAPNNTRTQQLP